MPVVNMPVELLLRLVNRGGADALSEERIPQTMHDIGVELDEITATRQYRCATCGRIIERTEAQGAALQCPSCGTDFRAQPTALSELGAARVARLDMLAVRPDIFDVGGMARYIRGFLGVQPGLIEYALAPARITVQVDPSLAREESLRPFISCAVVRGVRLDDERVKFLMNLQENLHWALGRDRKLASIGIYDLDTLSGDAFAYRAVAPDGVRFVPLGFSPAAPDSKLTPREILERHKTGQAYAHLLQHLRAYPLLQDAAGAVLSMPPIINSEATRVTPTTRNLFIDVTGLSQRTVDRALNIIVAGVQDVLSEATLEAVAIVNGAARRSTPDLAPATMTLDLRAAAETIGVELRADELRALLERMGHSVAPGDAPDRLTVRVPAWRNDVMHPVDLIEDAAVAYGYDKLAAALVPTFTVGRPRAIEEYSALARRVFTGLGYHQVMTLVLTSEAAAFDKWRLPVGGGLAGQQRALAVRIENPISSEQTICRVSLMPGLLETLAINKQFDLPQTLFEVGDCSFVDADAETGARERRYAATALIGPQCGFADVRAALDALAHELDVKLSVQPVDHPAFVPGRGGAIHDARGTQLGLLGEVHPEIIEGYGLRHAVAVLELDIGRLLPA